MRTSVPTALIRAQVAVPLRFADGFATDGRMFTFDGLVDGREHIAIGLGNRSEYAPADTRHVDVPLVRPHSECLTGDVLGSQRCDCGPQLREAVERIALSGGYLLYLRQEGRGIGLYSKVDAYALQDSGLDTYDANVALGFSPDDRDYTVAAQMLRALGDVRVSVLSNNPDKVSQLRRLGITVTSQEHTAVHLTEANATYLATKACRGAHGLNLENGDGPNGWLMETPASDQAVTGISNRAVSSVSQMVTRVIPPGAA